MRLKRLAKDSKSAIFEGNCSSGGRMVTTQRFSHVEMYKKNLENKKFLSQDDGLCYLEIRTYVVIMRKQTLLLRDSEGNVISVHLM